MEHAGNVKVEKVVVTFHADGKVKRCSRCLLIPLLGLFGSNHQALCLTLSNLQPTYLLQIHCEVIRLDLELKSIKMLTRLIVNAKLQLHLLGLCIKQERSLYLNSAVPLFTSILCRANTLKRNSFWSLIIFILIRSFFVATLIKEIHAFIWWIHLKQIIHLLLRFGFLFLLLNLLRLLFLFRI